ncbi:hypothetical protein [Celeribacter sp.]|uniref:hypothetical protein n=1 Tax=Celeribacter sp. TaxID=1890673 RepID=UPI003A95CE3C
MSALSREPLGGDDEYDPECYSWIDIQGMECDDHFSSYMFAHKGKDTISITSENESELADFRTLNASGGMRSLGHVGTAILLLTLRHPSGAAVKDTTARTGA